MKTNEEQWNRWLDGTLPPEEAEAMAAAAAEDEALAADQAFFSRLSTDLQRTFPAERTPPYADFFNNHLQKQIRDLQEADRRQARAAQPGWWSRAMGSPLRWALPLAGAAAAVLVVVSQMGPPAGQTSGSRILYAYTPDDSVFAQTAYNEEVHGTVIRLEGMKPLPEGFDLLLADAAPAVDESAMVAAVVESGAPVDDGGDRDARENPGAAASENEAFVFVGPEIHFTSHRGPSHLARAGRAH